MEKQLVVEIIEFSYAEASNAADYAAKKYGYSVNKSFLRMVGNKILLEMRGNSETFENVRRGVLNGLNIRPCTTDRQNWNSALGKMFAERRATKQKYQPKGLQRIVVRPKVPKTIQEPNGQLAWRF